MTALSSHHLATATSVVPSPSPTRAGCDLQICTGYIAFHIAQSPWRRQAHGCLQGSGHWGELERVQTACRCGAGGSSVGAASCTLHAAGCARLDKTVRCTCARAGVAHPPDREVHAGGAAHPGHVPAGSKGRGRRGGHRRAAAAAGGGGRGIVRGHWRACGVGLRGDGAV